MLIIQVRPLSTKELVNDEAKACVQVDEAVKQIKIGQDKRFTFDHVFGPESGQSAVYDGCVKGLVDGCLAGYNSCILAYGQTVRHDEMLRPSDPFPVQCASIAPAMCMLIPCSPLTQGLRKDAHDGQQRVDGHR